MTLNELFQRVTPRRHFTVYDQEVDGTLIRYWHTWRQWGNHIWSNTKVPVWYRSGRLEDSDMGAKAAVDHDLKMVPGL